MQNSIQIVTRYSEKLVDWIPFSLSDRKLRIKVDESPFGSSSVVSGSRKVGAGPHGIPVVCK